MAFFTPEQIAILKARVVRVDLMAEFRFQDETVRTWNGNTELVAGGHTWTPLYGAATVEGLAMSGGTVSESVTFTLNGLPGQPADFLRAALEETTDVQQQLVIVYLQLFERGMAAGRARRSPSSGASCSRRASTARRRRTTRARSSQSR